MLANNFEQSLRIKAEGIFARVMLNGGKVAFEGRSATAESAFLRWCLEMHIIDKGRVETLVDCRLKSLGRLMLDQAIRNEVDSPEALAYAVRNGVLSEKELRSIELHDAVSITMQNRIDDLLKSVVQQLLQDPLGGGG